MNYTTTKSSVIFKMPLSDYLGKSIYYNHKTKKYDEKWLNSVKDYKENFFNNFQDNYNYIKPENLAQYYDNYQEAVDYLLAKGYTQTEIDFHQDIFNEDVHKALSDAWSNSYQDAWLNKFFIETQEQIEKDLKDNLENITYKLLDDLTDKDFKSQKTDQEYLRLEIDKKDIKDWLKNQYPREDWHKQDDYIDTFNDYALDYERNPINTTCLDYYGTMGNHDDWLECFKNYNKIEDAISKYRQDEAEKIDNFERANFELKLSITTIANYIDKYITKEPAKTKITRQIKALKSIIKNAE